MKNNTTTVSFSAIVRSYGSEMRKYPLLVFGVFVGTVCTQLAGLTIPVFLARFFNQLIAIRTGSIEVSALYTTLGFVALFFFFQWLSRRVFSICIVLFESRVMHDLYLSSFSYLLRHSQQFFASQFSGTLTRRVSKYVSSFETLFDSLALTFTPTLIYISGAIIVLFRRNVMLGAGLLAWSLIFFSFQIIVSRMRQPIRVRRAEADSRMVGGLADAITNQQAITHFANFKKEFDIFSRLAGIWKKATDRSWLVDEYIWAAQGFLMIGIQIGLLFGALYVWQAGKLQVGDFVLIQVYSLGIIDNLVGISRELRRVYDAVADAGEMVQILEEPHEIQDIEGAKDLKIEGGAITFDHVGFSYGDTRESVLNDFSINIRPGERVGLVGKSGAGKSTVTKLLLRTYDVQSGTIKIDGQDISEVTQDSLHRAISVVPQESILFHRSLSENIAYGKNDATQEEIEHAAELAQADQFISVLPSGYETPVGERGVKLSGGERQRVAIARAILKNAPILLLDEATASLDSESEVAIQDALHELMQGKTVIAIAHRLSTLREMDRIVVLDEGKITEEGTHAELLEHGGIYAELWKHQAGGFLQDE
jgi:ATP-binding cassette subfamily B protein